MIYRSTPFFVEIWQFNDLQDSGCPPSWNIWSLTIGSLKSPCSTCYGSSIETILRKSRYLYGFWRQTDKQMNKPVAIGLIILLYTTYNVYNSVLQDLAHYIHVCLNDRSQLPHRYTDTRLRYAVWSAGRSLHIYNVHSVNMNVTRDYQE